MKFSLASENLLSTVKNRADLLIVLVQNGHAGFASGKTGVQAALNQARERGATSIVVTHRPQIVSIASKMMVLKDGELVQFGATQDVLNTLREATEKAKIVELKREAAE